MGQFIIYAIIFAAGWIANHMMFKYHMHENPEKMLELVEQLKQIKETNDKQKFRDKEPDVIVRVEHYGTLTYLFDKTSDQFLGQGLTIDEAMEKAVKRFPDTKFLVE
jgi:hypothetical protein